MNPARETHGGTVVTLKYGREEVTARLGADVRVKTISPADPKSAAGPAELVRRALDEPVDSLPLADLARGKRRVVVSIPDGTRPPVAREALPVVLETLAAAGIRPEHITIFIASGAHTGASEETLRKLVGPGVPAEISIHQNYARRAPDFRLVGITRRGTPIMLNNLVLEADLNVVIGAVAFHYFAGMAGGRKMVVPGACHVQTVAANHKLTIRPDGTLNPQCANGALEGNPVHEDMLEGMAYLKNIFMINLVLDGWAQVGAATSGDAVRSHLAASRLAKDLLQIPIAERSDLAVAGAGGDPLDINLIQAHKSIDHAAQVVRDGGVLVVAAQCPGGVGSETFLPWFAVGDARAVSRKLFKQYELNGQTALSLIKKLERIRIILVTSLEREVVESTGMDWAATLDEAVAQALCSVGNNPLAYILPSAWGILPVVEA